VITAVDSSVLFDVIGADPTYGPASANALRIVIREGRLIACEVVWAEVAASFVPAEGAQHAFKLLNLEFSALTVEAALKAGGAWSVYRTRGGTRTRVTADFLVGAHALTQADRLLTRDRGFYRSYFKGLSILDPSRI